MPSFRDEIVDGQIILTAVVSLVQRRRIEERINPDTVVPYKALLDTGAQSTMISQKVVDQTGLVAVGIVEISGVSGEVLEAEKFRAGIGIPIPAGETATFMAGRELEVSLLPFQPENFDILLGMDFLEVFHLTMHKGLFILSN